MEIDDLLACLRAAKPYLQQAHDEAAARHDTYGEDYQSEALWAVMRETEALIERIDQGLREFSA